MKTKNGTKVAAKSPAKTKRTGQGARASASTTAADKTPTPAGAPVAAARDREKEACEFREYWGKVFQSPGVVYARRVAALFGFEWQKLESWMCDCIAGRADPGADGDDTPKGGRRRKWWDMSILQVYGWFYALKANGASADDCEKCVAVVAPFGLEYWRAPSRGDEIGRETGAAARMQKDDEGWYSLSEWRVFFGAMRRLWFTVEAVEAATPPPLAKGRARARRKVGLQPPPHAWLNNHHAMIRAFCEDLRKANMGGFEVKGDPESDLIPLMGSAASALRKDGTIDRRRARGEGGRSKVFDAWEKWSCLPQNEKWFEAAGMITNSKDFDSLLESIRKRPK